MMLWQFHGSKSSVLKFDLKCVSTLKTSLIILSHVYIIVSKSSFNLNSESQEKLSLKFHFMNFVHSEKIYYRPGGGGGHLGIFWVGI